MIFSKINYSENTFCGSYLMLRVLCVQSSGKLEMERGMVKPMIRGEQQDSRSDTLSSPLSVLHLYPLCGPLARPPPQSSLLMVLFCPIRSQDISADRAELTLPAGIEFRDNCEYLYVFLLSPHCVSETVNNWKLLNPPCCLYNALDWFCWQNCLINCRMQ